MMMLRCDHCRGQLGLLVHRYWQMRFCSAACVTVYRRRLGGETRVKIRRLDRAPDNSRTNGRRLVG